MRANALAGAVVALLALSAAAVGTPAQPYEGVVTGTDVYVRSGPGGQGAYPCAKLDAPARVTVVERLDDWLKIAPPPGCYSAVSKTYVQVDPATKLGTITGDNVWVRAAGVLRSDNFFLFHARLNKGDRVRVIGEAGDYYKIDPPPGAYFWISAKYVRLAGAAEPPPAAPTTRPVSPLPPGMGEISVTVAPPPTRPTAPVPPSVRQFRIPTTPPPAPATQPRQLPPSMAAFNAAEKLLIEECKKPVEQREFDSIVARYKAIDTSGDNAYLKQFVDARIGYIEAAIEQKAGLEGVQKLVEAVSERERQLKIDQARIQAEAPTTRPVTAYAAQGVLLPSDIFPGGPGKPKRYIVRDRYTFFINAYVQCTTGAVSLESHVGKLVGIMGSTQFDKSLGLDVVEAREVKVLVEDVQFPSPPEPMVKPMPKPAPKPSTPSVITPVPSLPRPSSPLEPPPPRPTTTPAVEPTPTITPTPLVEPTPTVVPKPLVEPAPAVAPAPSPAAVPAPPPAPSAEVIPIIPPEPLPKESRAVTVTPAPSIEPAPAVVPVPKVEPTPPPTVVAPPPEPAPVVKPELPAVPMPKVEPTPPPTVVVPPPEPAPVVKPELPAVPMPKVEPTPVVKPEPPVVPTPKVEPTAKVELAPKVEPAPIIKPAPVVGPAPIVRFGPATRPATQPSDLAVPKVEVRLPAPTSRPIAPTIEEKEYD